MTADRLMRDYAWEPDRGSEQRPGRPAAPHEPDPAPGGRAPAPNPLAQLMREAARALQAAEARAAELEQQVARADAAEQQMAQAIRSEQLRAEAAEARARAAEDRLDSLEQRAVEAIRRLERRAEIAQSRVRAAEEWVERVRTVVATRPAEIAPSEDFSPTAPGGGSNA